MKRNPLFGYFKITSFHYNRGKAGCQAPAEIKYGQGCDALEISVAIAHPTSERR